MFTVFEKYAQEYGEYFQGVLDEFEEKFEALKRDI